MKRLFRRNYSTNLDFEPHSVIKVISRNGNPVTPRIKHEKKVAAEEKMENISQDNEKANVNEMGVKMISKNLFEQIFGNVKTSAVDPKHIEK